MKQCVFTQPGSFATESSQQQVWPCPLCPESDRQPSKDRMSRRARNRLMHCNMIGGPLTYRPVLLLISDRT
jgi:hypothetical protein